MNNTTINFAAFGMAALLGASLAQGAPNVSGSVQASYNYNLTIPKDSTANLLHSYDAQSKTFTLNSAHLAVSGSDSATGLGYVVETDFGSDAVVNSSAPFSPGAGFFDVQEAYVTYAFGNGKALGLKAGKFVTHEGIEVIEGGANPTITRGFLFGLAECFTHTGLEASYDGGMWSLTAGVINGWDQLLDVNAMPTFLGAFGLNLGDPLTLNLSALAGPEQPGNTKDMRLNFDVTGVTKVLPSTDLWFQVNYGMEDKVAAGEDASWYGFGLQPLVRLNDMFGIGARYEYFQDDKGARTGAPKEINLQNVSIAPTFWLTQNLTARAELRLDFASEDVFMDSDGKPAGSQAVLAADLIASF